MTLATRNAILLVGIIFASVVLGFAVYVVIVVGSSGYRPAPDTFVSTRSWLVWSWNIAPNSFVATIVEIVLLSLISSAGGLLLRRFFLKTTSPEVFFFIVFVFSLCFDGLKAIEILLLKYNVPAYYGMVVTRTVSFGHFVGMFSLLAASLYAVGVQYQKHVTVLGISALVAFALAYVVPVDSLVLYPDLVYRVGNESTIQIIQLILVLLIIASYASAVFKDGTKDRVVPAAAISVAVLGRELLFITSGTVGVIVGLTLLVAGAVVYSVRNYDIYLWT